MKLDNTLFDQISAEAVASPRLRMARDLRNTPGDQSQRMLNAIEPGTELPIHRHIDTSETCIIVRGEAEEQFFDDHGNLTGRILMRPGGDCPGVNIPAGCWHRIISLAPGTLIFEAKDGPYRPLLPEEILQTPSD